MDRRSDETLPQCPLDGDPSPPPHGSTADAVTSRAASPSELPQAGPTAPASPPSRGQARKVDETEFKDSPRVGRVWSQRRAQHNAIMTGRKDTAQGLEGAPLELPPNEGSHDGSAPQPVAAPLSECSSDENERMVRELGPAPDARARAAAAEILSRLHRDSPPHPHTGGNGSTAPQAEAPARPPARADEQPAHRGAQSSTSRMRAPDPVDVTTRSATPMLPPSTVASRIPRTQGPGTRAGPTAGLRAQAAPGGFLRTESDASFERRMAAAAEQAGEDAMDVDELDLGPGHEAGVAPARAQSQPISIASKTPSPAPGQGTQVIDVDALQHAAPPVKQEQDDMSLFGDLDLQDPQEDANDPTAGIHNPVPADDLDRANAGRYSPRFAGTKIKVAALRRTAPCTDGHLAGARSARLNPPTALKWRARRANGELGVGMQVHSVAGDTDIAAINPVRLKIELTESLQLLLPSETPRVAPALGVHGGLPMPPGVFNVDSLHEKTAADLLETEFLIVGRICIVVFNWDHGNSDFMGTFGEAIFEDTALASGLATKCMTSPEIRAVFRTLESRFPGYGAQARQRFADSITAAPISVTARGASWIDYEELNVYGRTAGLIPPDELGRPQELPADIHVALRAAFATLFVQDDDIGRAVIRPTYGCAICASRSHPTGKCPALTLEGWPRPPLPGEGRRQNGAAAQSTNPFQITPAMRARGRGGALRAAAPGSRGRGGFGRGANASAGWGI